MFIRGAVAGLSILALSACGGGGGGQPTYNALNDATVTSPTTVKALAVAFGTGATSSTDTTYTHATKTFNANGNVITADTAGLTAGMDHVATVAAASVGAAGNTRMIANQTAASDMPTTGTLVYNGKAVAQVNDGANVYDAEMNAVVTANLSATGAGARTVNVALSGVQAGATQTAVAGGASNAYVAGGAETVGVTGIAINGATFSGTGVATANNWNGAGNANIITGAQTVQTQGTFAGPQAAEVAGVASASGATNGKFVFFFGAKR